jgi:hypothetical protein
MASSRRNENCPGHVQIKVSFRWPLHLRWKAAGSPRSTSWRIDSVLGCTCPDHLRVQLVVTSQKVLWEHRSLRVVRIGNPRKPRKFAGFLPEPHARLFVILGERLK